MFRQLARVSRNQSKFHNSLKGFGNKSLLRSLSTESTKVNNFLDSNDRSITKTKLTSTESLLRTVFGVLCSPTYLLGNGWMTNDKNTESVFSIYGKYQETIPEGLHFRIPVGAEIVNVFTGDRSYKTDSSKVLDVTGTPLVAETLMNYRIVEPEKLVFNLGNNTEYIHNQADVIMKNIIAKYPYESGNKNEMTLSTHAPKISIEMKDKLNDKLVHTGAFVDDFDLTNIFYPSELAQHMLIKQQALAYVGAKAAIATAGVDIVKDTLDQLKNEKIEMNESERSKLINNMLTVIASGNNVQPTLPM